MKCALFHEFSAGNVIEIREREKHLITLKMGEVLRVRNCGQVAGRERIAWSRKVSYKDTNEG